jgi:uncharacterized protein YndB with AHSA1/START domain
MIKAVQWTLAIVGIAALLVVGAGFFLPSSFAVERAIVIDAPADRVFNLLVDPREWKRWAVWNQRDPAMEITYGGPPFGQGARWSWKSESEGSGSMVFTRVVPNERVAYELSFPEFGMKSEGELMLVPAGSGTRVTWTNRGDVGRNPLKRYLAVSMDRLVGPDFEAGLANLKQQAEKP